MLLRSCHWLRWLLQSGRLGMELDVRLRVWQGQCLRLKRHIPQRVLRVTME